MRRPPTHAASRAVTSEYKDEAGMLAGPNLAPVRGDPRFAEIVKRLG